MLAVVDSVSMDRTSSLHLMDANALSKWTVSSTIFWNQENSAEEVRQEVLALAGKAHFVVSLRSPYRIISVSSKFSELIGYSEDELLGRSLAILRGPETETPLLHGAIKGVESNPQENIEVTLYGRSGDTRKFATSFFPVLDCDGYAIGCDIAVYPKDEGHSTSLIPHIQLHGAGLDCAGERRKRHNLYVGLLLESEAKAGAQSVATRHADEALLCQLLAAV